MVPITTAAFRRNLHQQRHIAHRAAASIRALGSRMIANSGYLQRIGFDSTQKAYFAEEHAGATEFRDAKVLGIVRTFQVRLMPCSPNMKMMGRKRKAIAIRLKGHF